MIKKGRISLFIWGHSLNKLDESKTLGQHDLGELSLDFTALYSI